LGAGKLFQVNYKHVENENKNLENVFFSPRVTSDGNACTPERNKEILTWLFEQHGKAFLHNRKLLCTVDKGYPNPR